MANPDRDRAIRKRDPQPLRERPRRQFTRLRKIEEREKQKRIIQAEGIARSMEIINTRLTSQYLQHEAIEAQKAAEEAAAKAAEEAAKAAAEAGDGGVPAAASEPEKAPKDEVPDHLLTPIERKLRNKEHRRVHLKGGTLTGTSPSTPTP